MKKSRLSIFVLAMLFVLGFAESSFAQSAKIQWVAMDSLQSLMTKSPKKVFVFVYTDWCSWCHKMDSTTLIDKQVVDFLNQNFYCVKFNAESKSKLRFKDQTYEADTAYVRKGRKGINKLTLTLLDNNVGFPSHVFFDNEFYKKINARGYFDAVQFLALLKSI